ncbi:MAG: peptidylprolyl isomerase [candidate division Zixibacteria bacterium]|nr:peptidylprolyl isomerase [candidate division Zixibacteria bacterium]
MKKLLIVLSLAVFGLIWISGCTSSSGQIVAKVGKEKITAGEIAEQYLDMKKNSTIQIQSDLPENEQLRRFVEQKIDSRLMLQSAYEKGFDKDPAIENKVAQEKERMLINVLITKEIINKVQLTDKDVREFYDKSGERAKVKHILVKTQKEAEDIYNILKKGANFDSLAKVSSMDLRSRDTGGDLGSITWYSRLGNMEFKEVAFSLKPQEISRPIKTYFGWHIIKLEEKSKEPPQKSFEEEKERMKMTLQMMRQQDKGINYMMDLMDKSEMKIVSSTKDMLKEKALTLQKEDTLDGLPQEINIDPDQLSENEKTLPFLKYKGGELNVDEFLRFYNRFPSFQRPPLDDEEDLKNMIFNQLLATEILVNLAKQKGIDRDKEYKNMLKRFEEGLVGEKFRNEVIWKDLTIEQADLEEYYQKNKDKYIDPAQVQILEILVRTEKEALDLLRQLRAGADFKELAQEKTLRTLAKERGGDIGTITRSTDPELFEAAFKLKKSEIGGPVHLLQSPAGEGYSVIKLLEKKEQKQKTLEEIEPQVRGAVTFEKKNALSMKWVAELRAKTEIDINQSAIDAAFKIVQKGLSQTGS